MIHWLLRRSQTIPMFPVSEMSPWTSKYRISWMDFEYSASLDFPQIQSNLDCPCGPIPPWTKLRALKIWWMSFPTFCFVKDRIKPIDEKQWLKKSLEHDRNFWNRGSVSRKLSNKILQLRFEKRDLLRLFILLAWNQNQHLSPCDYKSFQSFPLL